MTISEPLARQMHILIDLHIAMENGDEEAADGLRDQMDLSPRIVGRNGAAAIQLLSGDLNDFSEVLAGTRTLREHLRSRLLPADFDGLKQKNPL